MGDDSDDDDDAAYLRPGPCSRTTRQAYIWQAGRASWQPDRRAPGLRSRPDRLQYTVLCCLNFYFDFYFSVPVCQRKRGRM